MGFDLGDGEAFFFVGQHVFEDVEEGVLLEQFAQEGGYFFAVDGLAEEEGAQEGQPQVVDVLFEVVFLSFPFQQGLLGLAAGSCQSVGLNGHW